MIQKIQTIRGMRDLMNEEINTYTRLIEIGSRIAKVHNYSHILLPILEYSSVFLRTLGEASDIVSKETYTFSDRDKRMVTLRPEFTAAIVRALISNGLTQNIPQRLFTYGPLFRHERPQQGRYRQFYQFDCELFGSTSPSADVEIIHILYLILQELGLNDVFQVEMNTLGDQESSERYTAALKDYLLTHASQLSDISKNRLHKNPLRVLDSKHPDDITIIKDAPIVQDYLNVRSQEHYKAVCEGLSAFGVKYIHNHRLVRGLDYYTHTVFEMTTTKLGSQNAIAAGGRYDNLVEVMGGPSVPAVGFAIGIDRIHELIKQSNDENTIHEQQTCYLVPIGENAEKHATTLAYNLRQSGIQTGLNYATSLKKSLKIANRNRMGVCIIFGDNEIHNNEYIVRNMHSGNEYKTKLESLETVILMEFQKLTSELNA